MIVTRNTHKGHDRPARIMYDGYGVKPNGDPVTVDVAMSGGLIHLSRVSDGCEIVSFGCAMKFWAAPVDDTTPAVPEVTATPGPYPGTTITFDDIDGEIVNVLPGTHPRTEPRVQTTETATVTRWTRVVQGTLYHFTHVRMNDGQVRLTCDALPMWEW